MPDGFYLLYSSSVLSEGRSQNSAKRNEDDSGETYCNILSAFHAVFQPRLLGFCIFPSFDWATTDDGAFVNTKSPAKRDICSLHSFTHDINLLPSSTSFHPFCPYLYFAYIRSVGLYQKTCFYKLKACFYLSKLLIVIALPRSSLTYF